MCHPWPKMQEHNAPQAIQQSGVERASHFEWLSLLRFFNDFIQCQVVTGGESGQPLYQGTDESVLAEIYTLKH